MKLSIFTPSHNAKYLPYLFKSLLDQSEKVDFEWVIVPNATLHPNDIQPEISSHNSVKIVPSSLKGIGALKKFACFNCTGDLLLEVDHDDILSTDTFSELLLAAEKDPNGMYYSDFVNFRPTGKSQIYNKAFGWEYYDCKINGRDYHACRSFEPSAASCRSIHWAPNHIRVWSRKAYDKLGGHNENMHVADDHELICRTYSDSSIPFIYIPKPLYLYRLHDNNTYTAQNKDIKTLQTENMNKYLYSMIRAECDRNGTLKVDLGKDTEKDFNSYDFIDSGLPERLDYENNSVGCFKAFDVLNKVPTSRIINLMNEIYRCLAPGGWFITATPSIDDGEGRPGRGAYQDPTNKSYWSQNNFKYFCERSYARNLREYIGRFQNVRIWTGYPTELYKKEHIPYVRADLCALKGQRQAGQVLI